MKTYRDGQSCPYGLFVSFKPIDARFVGADSEDLEGLPGAAYRRVPTIFAVALAPVLGGMFVMLFPLLVVLATAAGLVRLAEKKLFRAAEAHPHFVRSSWEPQAAYLDKSVEDAPDGEPATIEGSAAKSDGELDALQRELEAKRAAETPSDEE